MKIKMKEFENMGELEGVVSVTIKYTIDNSSKLNTVISKFQRSDYKFLEIEPEETISEVQRKKIVEAITKSSNKKLINAVVRPKGKEKPIVTYATVDEPVSDYVNTAMVDFKLQGEETTFTMVYYHFDDNVVSDSSNWAIYMYTPLYKYTDDIHEPEIVRQVLKILSDKGESLGVENIQ